MSASVIEAAQNSEGWYEPAPMIYEAKEAIVSFGVAQQAGATAVKSASVEVAVTIPSFGEMRTPKAVHPEDDRKL